MINILITILISFSLIYICNKNQYLLNFTGSSHQRFINQKNVPLLGGVIIIIFLIIFLSNIFLTLKFFLFSFFLVGLLSDLKILNSPKLRFLIQMIIIIMGILILQIFIIETKLSYLNELISQNKFINIILLSFCFLIIINGTNFIDGANTIVIGYYSIILCLLLNVDIIKSSLLFDLEKNYFIVILFFLFLLNFLNKIFLGDSGAYLISFLFSFLLLEIHMVNPKVSPYFIILLLWYPGFENLFSIIRKYKYKKSALKPDVDHLHQLIFFYFKKKKTFKEKYLSSFTGLSVNTYNFIIFFFACHDLHNTNLHLILLFFSTLTYSILYLTLSKFKKK